MRLKRYEGYPILAPDKRRWRNVITFNPGAIVEDGILYVYCGCCDT